MTDRREVYLIDGSSYIYRAFYAMRNLSTASGLPTNAVYICARMLLNLLKEKTPGYICFVLDSKGPTFRHEMFKDYKATRQRMPEDLQVQVPYILKIVDALGIPTVSMEGLEADDIIATLARRCGIGCRVVVVSGDKDLMQLVNEDVVVWDTLNTQGLRRPGRVRQVRVYPSSSRTPRHHGRLFGQHSGRSGHRGQGRRSPCPVLGHIPTSSGTATP